MSPAERYAAATDNFTVRGRGERLGWSLAGQGVDRPRGRGTPGHLGARDDRGWVRGSNSPSGEGALADPVAAWRALDERLREVLADEELAVTVHSNPHTGRRRSPR